ncbi:hypothetical protein ABK040_005195 [Willaertia magna]
MSSQQQPCKQYIEEGYCMKGPTCKYFHSDNLISIKQLEFLFEYETIINNNIDNNKKRKAKKMIKSSSPTTTINNITSNSSTINNNTTTTIIKKKSKKMKPNEIINLLNNDDQTIISTINIPNLKEEENTLIEDLNFKIPKEYENINFDQPIQIPFNFHYHTPTHQRQKSLEQLIDKYSKIYKNKKQVIILALQKELDIYNNTIDKLQYFRNVKKELK